MGITAPHKQMALILAPENPMWARVCNLVKPIDGPKRSAVKLKHIAHLSGVSEQTLKNWLRLRNIRPSTAKLVFSRVRSVVTRFKEGYGRKTRELEEATALIELIDRCEEIFEQADVDLYDVARLMSMTAAQAHLILERMIYEQRPLMPAAYYPARAPDGRDGSSDLEVYEGVYLLWSKRGDVWLQCPLRVRSLCDHGQWRFIRCKMNVPIIDPTVSVRSTEGDESGQRSVRYWEYDGIVCARPQNLYFFFEKRSSERNDYFQFITATRNLDDEGGLVQRGVYLTTDQDEAQSITFGDVLMERMFRGISDPEHVRYREVMDKKSRVLRSPEELAEMKARWERYCRRRDQ